MRCPYDIEKLRTQARARLVLRGIEPTCLAIYHMVTVLRGEELRAGRDERVQEISGPTVVVDCTEDGASNE